MALLSTAIIIDSNPANQKLLCAWLTLHFSEIEIMEKYQNMAEAKIALLVLKPDIIFIDPDNCVADVFKYLETINRNKTELMIVNSFKDETINKKIMNLKPDYLYKPYKEEQFIRRIRIMLARSNEKKYSIKYLTELQQQSFLETNQEMGTKRIVMNDIVFIESKDSKVHYNFKVDACFSVTKTLTECDDMLNNMGFYRVQKSFIVSVLEVYSIHKTDRIIYMKNYPKNPIRGGKDNEVWKKFVDTYNNLY